MSASNRKLKQQLTRALAAPPQSRTAAVPETLLHRCRAAYHPCPRGSWKNLLYWQLRLLGWKAAGLEAFAALALYSVGRALGLWDAAWSLRNALFGLTALAMCTALLGLPFLCRASQYNMLELERAARAGIGTPLVLRFLLLLAGEVVLLAVLAISVYAAAPLKLGQLVCLLAVPFLLANNELLLLVRRVRPERLVLAAVPLFAGQLCLLRLIEVEEELPQLPAGLPLAAGVLAVCLGGQCAKLAARPEYTAEI